MKYVPIFLLILCSCASVFDQPADPGVAEEMHYYEQARPHHFKRS